MAFKLRAGLHQKGSTVALTVGLTACLGTLGTYLYSKLPDPEVQTAQAMTYGFATASKCITMDDMGKQVVRTKGMAYEFFKQLRFDEDRLPSPNMESDIADGRILSETRYPLTSNLWGLPLEVRITVDTGNVRYEVTKQDSGELLASTSKKLPPCE